MNSTEIRTNNLSHLACAVALGVGLSTASAPAQAIREVGGDGVIATESLTTDGGVAKLATQIGSNWRVEGSEAGGGNTAESFLVSPAVVVPTTGSVTLKFDHRYFFEDNFDGGAVYVRVNGEPATYVPGTSFSANGYVGPITGGGTAWPGGENVFHRKSTGYDTPALIQSVANLGTLTAGDTVSVEFRGIWDEGYAEPGADWEIGTVTLEDAATTAILEVDFAADGPSGFTVVDNANVSDPWTYAKAVHTFEIDADLLTADRYKPDIAGSVIDLNGAGLAVEVLTGTLHIGDTFSLFDLSGGTTLTGSVNSITLPGGTWDVSNLAVDGTIEVLLLPALVHEPFDYPAGNLAGNDGGSGFAGPWASRRSNNTVTAVNNFWGSLGTSGGRVNPPGWSYIERPIGTTLSDAGLMANGATVWFSYVMDILGQNLTNLDFNFALSAEGFYWDGTNNSYGDRTNLASGEGIGVSNTTAGNIRGAYWQDDDGDTIAEGVREVTTLQLNAGANSRALIVGKIEWGATDTDPEKLTLYAPDLDRNLGTPILDGWATPPLDQSLFDQISMEWKDSQPSIDEIRFGATSGEVMAPDTVSPTLASTIPANNEPQASGVYFVATFNEPIGLGASGEIRIIDAAGPATLTTIPVTDAAQVAVSADGFGLVITPTAVPTPGSTYYVEIDAGAVTDYNGNPFAGISGSSTWSFTAISAPPTVAGIDGTPAASPVYGTPTISYTVAFDRFYMDDATVTADDFANAGTAAISVGAVTRISADLEPAVYAFDVTTTSFGTVQLQITGAMSDVLGNPLATPVGDEDTYTLDPGPEPTWRTVTFDGFFTEFAGGTDKTFTYDASGSDKLVVVVSGEHNFGGNLSGDVVSITYDGVSLTKAIEIAPQNPTLQTTSDLWYLDDPGLVHTAGTVVITVVGNGNNYVHTAIGLSGTAPGFGAAATAIGSSATQLITSSPSSLVISWIAMGGSGNTAASATSVTANSPTGATTFGGVKTGGNYAGQVLAWSTGLTPDAHTFSFDTPLTDILGLAVEFLPAVDTSDYTIWVENYLGADLADPNADLDGDGLSNDEERLFGLDPTDPTSLNPVSVPPDAALGTLSFTRRDDALTGRFSRIEVSTDLVMWTVDADAVLVAGAPDANSVETVAVTLSPGLLTAPKLFVRVVQGDGVVFSANFEDSNGGFTATGTPNDWAWGAPDSDNNFDLIVNTGNGSSAKCWGTNLGNGSVPSGLITANTNSILRSPDINLTSGAGAQLQFAAAVDAAAGDSIEVLVKEVGTDALLETVNAITAPATTGWANRGPFAIPGAAGKNVYLEFRFQGTNAAYLGLYIDDVTVKLTIP